MVTGTTQLNQYDSHSVHVIIARRLRQLPSVPIIEIEEKQDFLLMPLERVRHAAIQYKKPLKDIEKIRKCIKQPSISYKEIGVLTFDYFIKMECVEDDEE